MERARQCEENRVQKRREDLLPVVEAYEHTVTVLRRTDSGAPG